MKKKLTAYIGHEFHGTISAGSPTIDYFVFSPISGVFSNFYPKSS